MTLRPIALTAILAGLSISNAVCGQKVQQRTIQATPAVSAVLASALPQTKVLDCNDAAQSLTRNNRTFHLSQQGLEVQGSDQEGHRWTAVTPASNILKCEVWTAPLKGGLPEDLIFLTADEIGGYSSELTILFFDKTGKPHPWQARGAFTSSSAGIQQLALNKGNGNAELIVPQREGDKFDGYAYVQNLYKVTPTGVSKVVGSDGANSWPSVSGNAKALVGTESRPTESDTFSSGSAAQAASPLRLTDVLSSKEDEPLIYSDGSKTRYPLIAIVDKADGSRKIFFNGDTPDAVSEIEKGLYNVQLKGSTCEEEECRPFILLAKASR